VWVKRTKTLVVNEWYMTDDYHRDNGDGADFYSVKTSRGCGGVADLRGRHCRPVSRNFVTSRVLRERALPPRVRAGLRAVRRGREHEGHGDQAHHADAGRNFNRVASTFKVEGGGGAPNWTSASHRQARQRGPQDRQAVDPDVGEGEGGRQQPRLARFVLPPGIASSIKPTDLDTVQRREGRRGRALRL
jgi:hypothetical protein